jgi:hypothetical protein
VTGKHSLFSLSPNLDCEGSSSARSLGLVATATKPPTSQSGDLPEKIAGTSQALPVHCGRAAESQFPCGGHRQSFAEASQALCRPKRSQ